MVGFGYPNDCFHHIWEAAATAPSLAKGVINLRRHDQRPWILLKQVDDYLFDFLLGDDVAVANQHLMSGGQRNELRRRASLFLLGLGISG
jgi:hypothetical protein